MRTWQIIGRHAGWVSGATITESINLNKDNVRRYTATIRGWRNFKIYEGKPFKNFTTLIINKTRDILRRIDSGDETVFN